MFEKKYHLESKGSMVRMGGLGRAKFRGNLKVGRQSGGAELLAT